MAELDLVNPRTVKLLIFASVIVGQLFCTGYFFDGQDKTSIGDDTGGFMGRSVIVAIASCLLMIPLKIIIGMFLIGAPPDPKGKRADLDAAEESLPKKRRIGYISVGCWIVGCCYSIVMFAFSFNANARAKWIITYFGSLFADNAVVYHLKLFSKLALGLILLKIAKDPIMMQIAGSCAGKCIDCIIGCF